MKVVEIPLNEFLELKKRYETCVKERENLKKINDFLNEQIKEYNKKYGGNTTQKN